MFAIDDRLRGLPASREQVISLHQSINSPHLAVPGKRAGPAQAYILGLRLSAGYSVFVYLYLAESGDCAVYVPGRRNLSAEEYPQAEAEAIAFAESMGFFMDNLNFRNLATEDQESLMKSLPVFQKEPGAGGAKAEKGKAPASALGRLLASF